MSSTPLIAGQHASPTPVKSSKVVLYASVKSILILLLALYALSVLHVDMLHRHNVTLEESNDSMLQSPPAVGIESISRMRRREQQREQPRRSARTAISYSTTKGSSGERLLAAQAQVPVLSKMPQNIPPVISGGFTPENLFWRRTYYQANMEKTDKCWAKITNTTNVNVTWLATTEDDRNDGTVVTMDSVWPVWKTGYSAGPKIPCDSIPSTHHNHTVPPEAHCDADALFLELDTTKALLSGEAFQFQLPLTHQPRYTSLVMDRQRASAATGVAFLNDGKHLVTGSFGHQKFYLYEYHLDPTNPKNSHAKLLDKASSCGNLELLKYDPQRNRIAGSNLHNGCQDILDIDIQNGKLHHNKSTYAFETDGIQQRNHGIGIFPSDKAAVVAPTSNWFQNPGNRNKWGEIMVRLFDYENQRPVADCLMENHPFTSRMLPKDVDFIDKHHMLVSMSGFVVNHHPRKCQTLGAQDPFHSAVALYRIHADIEDIVVNNKTKASSNVFELVDFFQLNNAAIDGITIADGTAMVTDQFNDKVYVFQLEYDSVTDRPQRITKIGEETGFRMPHSVTLSKMDTSISDFNMMAVTTYGDNSVTLRKLPSYVLEARQRVADARATQTQTRSQQGLYDTVQGLFH